MPGSRSVLVLGGGVAGLQAAIDIANLGFSVHLIERAPSIGGRMAQLDKTFPTNDCSMCILAPRMIECANHPNVTIHSCSELESLEGKPGRFRAVIRKKSRYVDEDICTGCGECSETCPVELPNEFEMGLTTRKAIYKPFPQAVPNVFAITKAGHAPCVDSCPAGINAQGYVQLVRLGKFNEALALVHDKTPFAGTFGRICHRPCETACARSDAEAPLAISALKRAAADLGAHTPAVEPDEKARARRSRRQVAVVGAGPGGLTAAYNLALKGYPVTVFEKLPVTGGMLRVGVPKYRLPWEVLDRDIDLVRDLGVKIKTSSPVKGPSGIRDLFRKGYKAVFLSTGAHSSLKLGVPGESLRGVTGAVEFLQRFSLGRKVSVGKSAVVIGGGNAAIDSARTLLRLGSRKVMILYRRTRAEMPALSWEIDAALEEGVELSSLAAPVKINGRSGRVVSIEAIRMTLGEKDSSGRPRPVPIEGSNYTIDCDMVVPAISQRPELDFAGPGSRLEISRWGTIVADPDTGATTLKGVFAGGDAVTGPATAIEAVAAANRAAEAIHRFLEGLPADPSGSREPIARPSAEDIAALERVERTAIPELPVENRRRSFEEVDRGFDKEAAIREAQRCLNCAPCCECRECEHTCQAGAIDHEMKDELVCIDAGACVIATGFDMMDPSVVQEYGADRIANVITGMEFERLLSASGPTGGVVRRPSDGRPPRCIAFIQCVGSRDLRNHAYCSAVCCMHATKEAILAREHDPGVRSTIFYMDLRAIGKSFQDYVARARDEFAVTYVRARPALLREADGTSDVTVVFEDTETRVLREEPFDLVVLCQAMVPSGGSSRLAESLKIEMDENGFILIPDPLGAPVDTTVPGLLAIGYSTGPKDIPDSVVEASAAAARVAELLRRKSHR